jgi:hypothetical protein
VAPNSQHTVHLCECISSSGVVLCNATNSELVLCNHVHAVYVCILFAGNLLALKIQIKSHLVDAFPMHGMVRSDNMIVFAYFCWVIVTS